MALSYFINRKKTTCVITFKGSLSTNDIELLDVCLKEAMAEPAQFFVLNMAGLKVVEDGTERAFTLFQQALRASSRLYLCDLQDSVERALKSGGVVRESEMQPDLLSALQQILNGEKG